MKFDRAEVGEVLAKMRAAVPEIRDVQYAGILLQDNKAVACNLEMSVSAELPITADKALVIPPRGVEFICSAVAPLAELEADDKELRIKSGTAKAKLGITNADDYPRMPEIGDEAKSCSVDGKELSWAISKVLYAVSRDMKKPAHTGLCFTGTTDSLEICALDGYRIAIAKIKCVANGDFRFVLPAMAAKAINVLEFDGAVEIQRDHKKAVIGNSAFSITTRLIAEPFLDYKKAISNNFKKDALILNRKEILSVLNRVKLARSANAKEKTPLVMDFSQNTGKASLKSSLAQMSEEFAFKGDAGNGIRMGFNIDFLLEALKSLESEIVQVYIDSPLSPVKLSEQNYDAVILPVRLKDGMA